MMNGAFTGSFCMDARIGIGKTSTVIRGVSDSVVDSVALKVFNPGSGNAFDRERLAYGQLRVSPSILSYEGLGTLPNGQSYIAFTEAKFGDLLSMLLHVHQFPPQISRRLFLGILSGVRTVHDSGLLHNDLTLENVLLNGKLQVQLCDFGDSSPLHAELNSYGTTNDKSEVFECGVLLFQLVLGKMPFRTPNRFDPFYSKIVNKRFDDFWRYFKSDDFAFRDLIQRLLAFDINERPTLPQVLEHPWMNGPVACNQELEHFLSSHHLG